MINFQEKTLSNGLTLITHTDKSTPLAVVNLLYKVGSRDEHPDKTGFAHLFEHLMFGGSKHVPDFDLRLQQVGAENNAFTSNDITNYYIVLGAENVETALWVESDRMKNLTLDQHVLDVQKKVVLEEYKQRYLDVPYGDAWLKLRPLAYKEHPYRWPTIGRKMEHIEDAVLEDVRDFYHRFYNPKNAILVMSGNVEHDKCCELAEKWFGDIAKNGSEKAGMPQEPRQQASRTAETTGNVPFNSIYKAYHMPGHGSSGYIEAELLSELLGRGKSSRLYQSLVKGKRAFSSINSFITGSADPGLLIISGKVNPDISVADANQMIQEEIVKLTNTLSDTEVEKVINQALSARYFADSELLNKSIGLSLAGSLGNTNLVNEEVDIISHTSSADILSTANMVLTSDNASTLFYLSKEMG